VRTFVERAQAVKPASEMVFSEVGCTTKGRGMIPGPGFACSVTLLRSPLSVPLPVHLLHLLSCVLYRSLTNPRVRPGTSRRYQALNTPNVKCPTSHERAPLGLLADGWLFLHCCRGVTRRQARVLRVDPTANKTYADVCCPFNRRVSHHFKCSRASAWWLLVVARMGMSGLPLPNLRVRA
jgi:hypothetical protein